MSLRHDRTSIEALQWVPEILLGRGVGDFLQTAMQHGAQWLKKPRTTTAGLLQQFTDHLVSHSGLQSTHRHGWLRRLDLQLACLSAELGLGLC